MIRNINWYPGHMKKTRELIQENLKTVDLVVEIVDSRIPLSSRNPIIEELVAGKKRVVILGKFDLADESVTMEWRPLRMMIVGVPNVGKSSFINRLIGRKSAKTGDRPGVTKGKQWVTLANGMQLLDTPGILWPKFEEPGVGLNLAFCGSIKDEILNVQDLAFELLKVLRANYPDELIARYKLDGLMDDDEEKYDEYGEPINPVLADMEAIAKKRGFMLSGGRIDYERTGRAVLDEFRAGLIGKISLERPEHR